MRRRGHEMRWDDGAACRAVHAVIRRERAKCAGLPSEEREKRPNRAVGEKPNQRLCDAQADGARPAPDVATFTEVTRPSTVEASTYRLHFGEPQVMAVMSAIAGFAHLLAGFDNPTLGRLVGALLDRPTPAARPPITCVGSNAKDSSFGHRDSTATHSHHRQTRRLVHQDLRTGPGARPCRP